MKGIIAIDPSVYDVRALETDKADELFKDFIVFLVRRPYWGVAEPLAILDLDGDATIELKRYCELFRFSHPKESEED